MFNKKILVPLAQLLAVLLAIKALFVIVFFVWGYFETPPILLFDPRAGQIEKVIVFLQEVGTIAFMYVFTGALAYIVMGKTQAPKATVLKPARRTTARKK